MPFFSAIPANLPITPEGVGAPIVSAGPYYVREWVEGPLRGRRPQPELEQRPRAVEVRSAGRRTSTG